MTDQNKNRIVFWGGYALIISLMSLVIFANSMTKPLGHDEQMYCTAGVLMAQGKVIWRDFSYVAQLPYHPLICSWIFKFTGTTFYLLSVRLLSCFCDIMSLICIAGIFRYLFKERPLLSIVFFAAAAALIVFNPLYDYATGYAWNHDVVIFLVMATLWIYITSDFSKRSRYLKLIISGLLLGVATFMRATTAGIGILFFIVLLFCSANTRIERFKNAGALLLGGAAASVWPVWIILRSWHSFVVNILLIPSLNGKFLHQVGLAFNKLGLTLHSITMPGYAILIILTVFLYVMAIIRKSDLGNETKWILPLLLGPAFILIAFIPPTIWRQYFAIPVPFLAVSMAWPLSVLQKSEKKVFRTACYITVFCAVMAIGYNLPALYKVGKLFNSQQWVPLRVHRTAQQIAQDIPEPKLILTMAPLYALEGGCDIYDEFSAGPFAYRVADFIKPSAQNMAKISGPGRLPQILSKSPPAAVIIGTEPAEFEAPLLKTVEKDWVERRYEDNIIIYIKPSSKIPTESSDTPFI